MEKMIRKILKIDKTIRHLYYIYIGVFCGIFMFFLLALVLWTWSIKVLLLFWVLVSYCLLLHPCIKDISNAIEGKYHIIEGKMIENSKAIESWQEGSIIDKNGKYVKGINFFYKKNLNNQYVKVAYLPHTRFGRIIEVYPLFNID